MRRKNLEVYQAAVKLAREKRAPGEASPLVGRTSGPEKFHSSTAKDFFNSIGAKRTFNKKPMACK